MNANLLKMNLDEWFVVLITQEVVIQQPQEIVDATCIVFQWLLKY